MKNSLLRNITIAFKICIIAFCFLNAEKTFAQVFEYHSLYQDKDGDGFGNPNVLCTGDWGFCDDTKWVENGDDCNDLDAAINPNTVWYKDLDNDGLTRWETLTQCARPPGYKLLSELYYFGKSRTPKCNLVAVGMQTLSNTIDNDDRFFIDINEYDVAVWYVDNDKDGFVDVSQYFYSFGIPFDDKNYKGFAMVNSLNKSSLSNFCFDFKADCNDNDPLLFTAEGWYLDGDGDGFPLNSTPEFTQCQSPAGGFYKIKSQLKGLVEDCKDTDPAIFPGTWYEDRDGDGLTSGNYIYACVQPAGYIFLPNGGGITDCDDTDPEARLVAAWYPDVDRDRHGNGSAAIQACKRPEGYFSFFELLSDRDCNDNNANVHPGATEFCNNGIDDDCNFQIDETWCCPPGNIIYVNAANTGVQDGTSWATAFKYFQDALELARHCNTVTQIWVAGGSYYPDEGRTVTQQGISFTFQPRGGLSIYGGFAGNETLLSQRKLSATPSILSGEIQRDFHSFNNSTHIMVLGDINTPFVLDGFTIQDGYSAFTFPVNTGRGIGLLVVNSTSAVRIRNCIFRNNIGNSGAAIANDNSNPIFINCIVAGNTTMGGHGAIWNDNSSPIFVNCSIADNAITGGDFIVIRNTGSSSPQIINSIVRGTFPAMEGGTPLVDHSYIQNFSVWPGEGNINDDPLFVDEANGNLRLQQGSPAMNAGWNAITPEQTDIEGKPRKIAVIDMGAYEDQTPPVYCTPITLLNTVIPALQINGCSVDDIDSGTFPFSTIPATLTSDQTSLLIFQVPEGSCDLASVSYKDILEPALNAAGQLGVIRTFTVTDANGATATATQQIKVADATAPTVLTKNISVQLGAGGNVTITAAQVNNGSFDACGIQTLSLNKTTFLCSNIGANTVKLTVTDINGNTASANATVFVEDHVAPTMLTKNITVQLTAGGNVIITAAQVNNGSFDACGIQTLNLSKSTFFCSDVGSNTVMLTATDANGNTATASATVTVEDHVAPTILTKNITVQMPAGGTVTITPGQVDNGSFDACGIEIFSLSKAIFFCSDAGANIIKLTATDANGNTASANATVTIEDHVAPTMLTKNITVPLTAAGNVTIMPALVNNGSFDACGILKFSLSKSTFLCSDVGANTVKLTATDANGNTASANATVTIVDRLGPIMLTKNITVQLTAGGNVTITAAQINNGSFDACGIQTFSLSKSTFNCSDIGPNTVRLTATDANGNTATANATVTVEDHVAPTMLTKNITVQLSNAGNVTITAAHVNNGSFDACGIQTFGLSKNTFDCSNVGANTITLKATDANGNTATASAIVLVEDKINPVITYCPTVPVQCYNANGVYTIPALTATDNCGISSISYIVSGATSRNGSGNASGAFNPGTSTIVWKVTDVNSNTATCTTTVKIDKVDATIGDVYASGINSSIGSPNTIYVGFGGSSVTLTAQVSGSLSPNSYTYKWTTGSPAGQGFATTQSITVSPFSTITYFLSVKDANNCSPVLQISKQINVVDIRCGADKIYVCQFKKGSYNTVCISSAPKTINGLPAGSYLGACNSAFTKSGDQLPTEESTVNLPDKKMKTLDLTARVSPNPSNTNFRIAISSNNQKDPILLQIADMLGSVIETRTTNAGQIITLGDEYRSGVYVVRIIQGKESKQLKLIKIPE